MWIDPVAGIALTVLGEQGFGQWSKDLWPPLADAAVARWGSPTGPSGGKGA